MVGWIDGWIGGMLVVNYITLKKYIYNVPLNEPKTILKLNGMWLIHIFILLSYLNNITILQYICNNTKTYVMFLFLLPSNFRILYITVYFYIYFWSLFFCSSSGPRWVNKAAANLFRLHVAFIGFKFQTLFIS